MPVLTIQPEVDILTNSTKAQNSSQKKALSSSISSRKSTITDSIRPSRNRNTESMAGSCIICGANSWDSDETRGETTCSECGYVATENMIDPGAEWVNHSNGDDRSRVGAPTTLTLSDKGLSTEIREVGSDIRSSEKTRIVRKGPQRLEEETEDRSEE